MSRSCCLVLALFLFFHRASGLTTGWNPASSPRSRVHVKRSMTEAWIAQDILDLAAASAGGTMGVMGTVLALELKKTEVMKRSECPYCGKCGHLTCARCMGEGTLMASYGSKQSCPNCDATGFITCVNCKGDGRLVPTMLDTSVSRDPESEFEDIGMT